jgi:hypothetical protein
MIYHEEDQGLCQAISRIQKLTETGMPFRKTDHISLHEYLQTIQKEIAQHPQHPLT